MDISVVDASNYFKGLLILIRTDRKVTESEIEMMKRIGSALGFEKEFVRQAIDGILENEHVRDVPPRFSSREIATKFVRDGLALSSSDNEIHPAEEEWLRMVAELNGLDLQWFRREAQRLAKRTEQRPLEVESLQVKALMK